MIGQTLPPPVGQAFLADNDVKAATMSSLPPATSLLEELDRRQDEVLAQLEELESRITQLLAEYSGVRPFPVAKTEPAAPSNHSEAA